MREPEIASQGLGRYVEPPLPEARLSREWGGVQASLHRRARAARWKTALGATLAAATVLVLAVRPWTRGEIVVGESVALEAGASDRVVKLADGSRVEMAPAARVTVGQRDESVRLVLARGRARFDVTHRPKRAFSVRARDVEVVVRGTKFVVEVLDQGTNAVRVTVQEGRVEVRSPRAATVQVLAAGQTWQSVERAAPVADVSPKADVSSQAADVSPPVVVPAAPATRSPPAVRRKPAPLTARALFESADGARRRGDFAVAAAALDRLRREFRSDARAGLGAFELGRLRLDAFRDPRGAVEALDDAVRLGPRAPYREDAEARRIEALEATGALDRCRGARADYLSRYPSGAHVATVARRCGAQ